METRSEKFKYKRKVMIITKTCTARNSSKNIRYARLILKTAQQGELKPRNVRRGAQGPVQDY